jgi:hypothetical protein
MFNIRSVISGTFLIGIGIILTLGMQALHAGPSGFHGYSGWLLNTTMEFKRATDFTLELQAESPTANALILDIRTGAGAGTTKFSVDEDGDVVLNAMTLSSTISGPNRFGLSLPSTGVYDTDNGSTPYSRVDADSFHTSGLGDGQMYIEGRAIDANTWIAIGQGLAGGQVANDVAIGDNNELYVDTNVNRVGVGTATPGYTLDVNGATNTLTFRINGDQLDATPTEIDQALDGISANVTATALSGLTGGGNADSYHSHLSGGADGNNLQQIWFDTDFNSSPETPLRNVEVSNGSIRLINSAPNTYDSTGAGTLYNYAISGFVYQTFTMSGVDTDAVDKVYLLGRQASGTIHAEIWKGDGSAQLGADSNTISCTTSWMTLDFANDIDTYGETTIQVRIYQDSGSPMIGMSSTNNYNGGQSSTGASEDFYGLRVYAGKPSQGVVYVEPDAPLSEMIDYWDQVSFGLTEPGTSTVTVDLHNTSTNGVIAGFSDIVTDTDISAVSTATNIGFKVTFTRTTLSNIPTFNWCARSFISKYYFKGTTDASGTTASVKPWSVWGVLNQTKGSTTAVYSEKLPLGYEYIIVPLWHTSTDLTLSTTNAGKIAFIQYERAPRSWGWDGVNTASSVNEFDRTVAVTENIATWSIPGGYLESQTISNSYNFTYIKDLFYDQTLSSTSSMVSVIAGYYSSTTYRGHCDLTVDGRVELNPANTSYDFATVIFQREK